ncbi:hypothetical protein MNEG_5822 [Monoraphidium neglectum]|uniref:MYND-type domain-containing protein n=1 Tax=Monoraphidium neglectum TaxID=145388 RepID=A0A0D2L4Z3_9CHLO|nr:hypothetical protein MNEG_5822 [Monoraphidium neglectum]KIZ02134.1 hypothetical protein MNEG_5822 [Monoraphidium neglectum]|eukprot:XP_013901153.1 hypothetical protein MNEG_5822 [Monoraphidium neglectum]
MGDRGGGSRASRVSRVTPTVPTGLSGEEAADFERLQALYAGTEFGSNPTPESFGRLLAGMAARANVPPSALAQMLPGGAAARRPAGVHGGRPRGAPGRPLAGFGGAGSEDEDEVDDASMEALMNQMFGMTPPNQRAPDGALDDVMRDLASGPRHGPDRARSLRLLATFARDSEPRARQVEGRGLLLAAIAGDALAPPDAACRTAALDAAAELCRSRPAAAAKLGGAAVGGFGGAGPASAAEGLERLIAAGALAAADGATVRNLDLAAAGLKAFTFLAASSPRAAAAAARAHPDAVRAAAASMLAAPDTRGARTLDARWREAGGADVISLSANMVAQLAKAGPEAVEQLLSTAPQITDAVFHLLVARRGACASFGMAEQALSGLCASPQGRAAVAARPGYLTRIAAALRRLPADAVQIAQDAGGRGGGGGGGGAESGARRPGAAEAEAAPLPKRLAEVSDDLLDALQALLGLAHAPADPRVEADARAPGVAAALSEALAPFVPWLRALPGQACGALNVLGQLARLLAAARPRGGWAREVLGPGGLRGALPEVLLGVGGKGGGTEDDEFWSQGRPSPGFDAQLRAARLLALCTRDVHGAAAVARSNDVCDAAAAALAAQAQSAFGGGGPSPVGGPGCQAVQMQRCALVCCLVDLFDDLVPEQGGELDLGFWAGEPGAGPRALAAHEGAGRRALALVASRLRPSMALMLEVDTAREVVERADSILRRLRAWEQAWAATGGAPPAPRWGQPEARAPSGSPGSGAAPQGRGGGGGGTISPRTGWSGAGGAGPSAAHAAAAAAPADVAVAGGKPPRECFSCGKRAGEAGEKLRACTGCLGLAYFCNVTCQRQGWPRHRDACRAAQAASQAAAT